MGLGKCGFGDGREGGIGYGWGYGFGNIEGDGFGYIYGHRVKYGHGSGFGYGLGYGDEWNGKEYGYGYGNEDGCGFGHGHGYGDGWDNGCGNGFLSECEDSDGYGYWECECECGSGYSDKQWAIEIIDNTQHLTNWYLDEENAEIRAKITEKIGIEPIMNKVNAKLIDKKRLSIGGQYELYQCRMFRQKRKFLKMKNPSTGIYHMEWVPRDINDVISALKWRNYGYLPKSIS